MASRLRRLLFTRSSSQCLQLWPTTPPLVRIPKFFSSSTLFRCDAGSPSLEPSSSGGAAPEATESPSPASENQAEVQAPTAESTAAAVELPPVRMPRKGSTIHNKIGKIPNNRAMRDFERRLCVAKYEAERLQYKAMIRDLRLPYDIRRYYQDKLSRLPRNSSKVRVRNRCIVTGRPRGVYRRLRVSRIVLRELSFEDALVGVYKASW